jgi:hypothetical protein
MGIFEGKKGGDFRIRQFEHFNTHILRNIICFWRHKGYIDYSYAIFKIFEAIIYAI